MLHKKFAVSLAAVAFLFTVSACSGGGTTAPAPTESGAGGLGTAADTLLAQYDIEAPARVEDLIEELQSQPLGERPVGLTASVRVDELLLSSEGQEVSLPLPEDQFHLSVAPYRETTHECFYHSLTTCTGELGGEELQVTISDDASGEVFFDGDLTTNENGFFDVWLPADRDITVNIGDGELTAEVSLGTNAEDPTCVTTVQLA